MSYPGNPSLSPDVQQRIITTYRQSLQGAARGNRDEALLGCDFIQRLDPQFQPARTLQQMLSANREPEIFQQMLAAFDGEGDLGGDADEDLARTFHQYIAERRFTELLNAAERDKRKVAADPALVTLVELAQGRHEAEPYVTKFLDDAAAALDAGNADEARRLLDKARVLDDSHPAIAAFERRISPDAPPAAGDDLMALPELDFDAFPLPSADEAGLPGGAPDFSAPTFDAPAFTEAAAAAPAADDGGGRSADETSGRITALLNEGQDAFDRGDYQPAIDAWSRIFLIDIDHEEAARKIERARQLKSEQEREVEEIFHEGVTRFDAGDLAASRTAFQRVLELQPSYALAREYLDKIEEREAGVDLPGSGLPELAPLPPGPPAARPATRAGSGEYELAPPAAEAPRERRRAPVGEGYVATAKRSASGPSPRFLLIGGAVLALLAVGAWLVFSQREKLFPNAEPSPAAQAVQADPIARAEALHAEGKTPQALAMLRRIPQQDARYAEAQSLVSQWEKIPGEEAAEAEDPALAARRRALLERGRSALEAGDNFRARRHFARAAELAPLDGEWTTLAAQAEERLAPLANEVQQFSDGDYEFLINSLWRRREAEPNNRDVLRMITDAYHNLGVLDLQRGDPAAAREKFREARNLDAADASVQRLERFAALYEQRNQDLLYRIFVKYAPMR